MDQSFILLRHNFKQRVCIFWMTLLVVILTARVLIPSRIYQWKEPALANALLTRPSEINITFNTVGPSGIKTNIEVITDKINVFELTDMELLEHFRKKTKTYTNTTQYSRAHDCEPVIPNFIHWTWFYKKASPFRFHNYISALSAAKTLQPEEIFFWYDKMPTGPLWTQLLDQVDDLRISINFLPVMPQETIFSHKVNFLVHLSDFVRMKVVTEFGGIYMDLDVVVVKSFDPLRCYETVLGAERPDGLCNGIIMAAPYARFMVAWYESYMTFDPWSWDATSVRFPLLLARRRPSWIHVEKTSLHRPGWYEMEQLYGRGSRYDWRRRGNYAVHLWYRKYGVEHSPDTVRRLNSTAGALMRTVYYGDGAEDVVSEGGGEDQRLWYTWT